MAYIGLDVGTSACKAAIVSRDGEILSRAACAYDMLRPQPGWAELSPRVIWRAVLQTLRDIAPHARDARAISVCSIGEALVLLDEEDDVLSNAIVYLDTRAEAYPEVIGAAIAPDALYRITGVSLNQMYSLPKLMWFQDHAPHVLARARRAFLVGDYITYLLSGVRAVDPSTASRTMLFDVSARAWSTPLFERFSIPEPLFSPIVPSGTPIGALIASIARETGLPEGIQVVAGAHDQVAATLGSGVLRAGDILAGEGTSESLNLIADESLIDPAALYQREICMEPFVMPGRFLLPAGQLSHGACIKWFVNAHREVYRAAMRPGESAFEAADRLCAPQCGGLYFLPYLSRVNCMDASSGAPACFLGIGGETGIHEMYRAVLEGLSYETRANMDLLREVGAAVRRVFASGGASRSAQFMQIKSDALGLEIETLRMPDSGIVGLAMLCAVALGDMPSLEDAASAFVRTATRYRPERDTDNAYAAYRLINRSIKALYRALPAVPNFNAQALL